MGKNALGPRIRDARYREERRVSQADSAARLQAVGVDIDQTAISRIENQERLVTDLEIIAICEALDITVASLFAEASGA